MNEYTLDDYKFTIEDPWVLTNNVTGIKLLHNKQIGSGGFGEVHEYTNNMESMVIKKITRKGGDDEINTIKYITDNKIICNIVNAKFVGQTQKSYWVLMHKYDGDMDSIINSLQTRLDDKQKIELILRITYQANCLLSNKLVCHDIKAANILFRRTRNNNGDDFDTFIADLGGIGIFGSELQGSTFPHPKDLNNDDGDGRIIVWDLLMLLVCLYTDNILIFAYTNMKECLSLFTIDRRITSLFDEIVEINPIVKKKLVSELRKISKIDKLSYNRSKQLLDDFESWLKDLYSLL